METTTAIILANSPNARALTYHTVHTHCTRARAPIYYVNKSPIRRKRRREEKGEKEEIERTRLTWQRLGYITKILLTRI